MSDNDLSTKIEETGGDVKTRPLGGLNFSPKPDIGAVKKSLLGYAAAGRVDIAELPAIGGASQGWGRVLGDALHGIRGQQLIAVGAKAAKSGKSYFVSMLADGLSMLGVPVVLLTENSKRAMVTRLACKAAGAYGPEQSKALSACLMGYMGEGNAAHANAGEGYFHEQRLWGALGAQPEHPMDVFGEGFDRVANVAKIAAQVLSARETLYLSEQGGRWPCGVELMEALGYAVAGMPRTNSNGGHAVPVVILDPFQRFIADKENEYSSTLELGAAMRTLADKHDCCVVMVSDTNKEQAKASDVLSDGATPGLAASAFKGAYELIHQVDAALVLERPTKDGELIQNEVQVSLAVNRFGPNCRQRFRVHWPMGNFEPIETERAAGRVAADWKSR